MKPLFLFVVFVVLSITLNFASAEPIHDAVKAGDLAKVQEIEASEHVVDIDIKDEQGYTPLHWAVDVGSLEISSLLLEKGADVNAVDNEKNTPLHIASDKGRPKAVALLIEHGADVNTSWNSNSKTPLQLAIVNGRIATVTVLLNHGATVLDEEGYSENDALALAISNEKMDIIKLLLSKGVTVDVSHAVQAIASHNLAIIQILCSGNNPKTNKPCYGIREGALAEAARLEDRKIFDYLMNIATTVDLGANWQIHSSLIQTLDNANSPPKTNTAALEMFERMFAADPDMRTHAGAMLPNSVGDYSNATFHFLLAKDVELNQANESGNTALHRAAEYGYLDKVRLLLERGAKIDPITEWGNTPLLKAVPSNRLDVVSYLLAHKANIKASNELGNTALHLASARNLKVISALLIANGAKVNTKNKDGNTPLHQSVRFPASFETAKLLIEQRADVNIQNAVGCTALHYLVARGVDNPDCYPAQSNGSYYPPLAEEGSDKDIIELVGILLEKGAKLQLKNAQGLTALDLARIKHPSLASYIEEKVGRK